MFSTMPRLKVIRVILSSLLGLSIFSVAANLMSVKTAVGIQNLSYAVVDAYVDLKYLAEHIAEFEGVFVTTNGTARYYASFFMFEDFWLEAQNGARIPVVARFAGLPVPSEGLLIEVSGKIEYCRLEGGFYFLNATSWRVIEASPTQTLPETQPQPSIPPPEGSTSESEQPPAQEQTSHQQTSSGLIIPLEYGLTALAVIAAVVIASIGLLHRREKQLKPSSQ